MIGTSAPGMNIKMLQWKEGLTVLFVDDSKGMHSSKGSSSTASPVHTSTGSAGTPETGGYNWQLDATEGKTATCKINGKEYDLTQGTVFVIKSRGNVADVHQLKRDLSGPLNTERIEKDAEIRKLLGLPDAPK